MKKKKIERISTHGGKSVGLLSRLPFLVVFTRFFLVAIAIVFVAACQENGPTTKDLGDGTLRDAGSGSYYPRFVAKVMPCPMGGESPCVRGLDGLPPSQYTVQVRLEVASDKTGKDAVTDTGWTALDQLGVSVSVELRMPNGGAVLSSFGGNLTKDWHSWKSGDRNFFCSSSLENLSLPEKVDVFVVSSIENPTGLDAGISIGIELQAGGKRI